MQEKKYICSEIKRVDNMIRRHLIQSVTELNTDDISCTNGWIIDYLFKRQDEDVFQRDIEEIFSIRRSSVSSIIQLMEKKDLIKRESVDYDARLKKLVLTEKAIEIHTKMLAKMTDYEQQLLKGISDEEINAFLSTLQKISCNIE